MRVKKKDRQHNRQTDRPDRLEGWGGVGWGGGQRMEVLVEVGEVVVGPVDLC